ncbi:MAG: glycosyl hydrolase family 25 [Bacteroidales bacterium]|nr:glycosyl hydrolase family 25 [Bacteroidales bacterium]
MNKVFRYSLFTSGLLLLSWVVDDIDISGIRLFPPEINIHCSDSNYWDARYEKSLKAILQPDVKGIDVSHHQGDIDWKKVKEAQPKLAFVYVKCTEGKSYVDPMFRKNAEGAASVGYKVGTYHYFRMTSGAREQFENFKSQMDAVHIDLIPMVDVERDDGKPRKELQDSLKVLLNLLEKAYGKRPMIYGTNRSYNELCAPEFNYYPLYIGRYGKNKPIVTGPSHYTIWQYSESARIPGIPKPVDMCKMHPVYKSSYIEL